MSRNIDSRLILRAKRNGYQLPIRTPLSNVIRSRLRSYANVARVLTKTSLGIRLIQQRATALTSGELHFRVVERVGVPYHLGDIELTLNVMLQITRQFFSSGDGPLRLRMVLAGTMRASTLFYLDLTGGDVLDIIAGVLQSDEHFDFFHTRFIVQYARRSRGNLQFGAYFDTPLSFEEYIRKKRCILRIHTRRARNDCFWQCLALGLSSYFDSEKFKVLSRIGNQAAREAEADNLMEKYNWNLGELVELNDLAPIENVFPVSIYVIRYQGMKMIYQSKKNNLARIYLLYYQPVDGTNECHFYYVKSDSVGSLWSKSKFCTICNQAYRNTSHACVEKCYGCKTTECPGKGAPISAFRLPCTLCLKMTFNQECLERYHNCGNYRRCNSCEYIYPKKEYHECGKRTCSNCEQLVETSHEHKCFIGKQKQRSEKKIKGIIYYDYETYVNDENEHEVALVVAQYDKPNSSPMIFQDHDKFIDWLFHRNHKDYICIAHNGSRFDFHFIKKEMLKRGIASSDIVQGGTILYSYASKFKLKFLDSYRFIDTALRNFPKTFGLPDIEKGYFPYRFLKKETLGYIGPIPSIEWFDFEQLGEKDYRKALQWYEEHKNDEIDLMALCIEYCVQDVEILRQGCQKFRALFLERSQGKIDPFQYVTIASTCLALYRELFMPIKTIAVLGTQVNSYKAQEWFATIQETLIPSGVKDAMKNEETKTIYHFLDCLYTGCRSCFSPFTRHPTEGIQMKDLNYSRISLQRIKWIEEGYTIESLKECEGTFVNQSHQFSKHELNMRDAFFGGRTEPTKLYYKVKEGEKVLYIDYTSLYPSVQRGRLHGITPETYNQERILYYPIGHPVYIYDNFGPIEDYFGFIKCRIVPPLELYHPVLPERKNGKLIFDLVPKTGTWTTEEVKKAVEKGYQITEIYAVCHFPQKTSDLFAGYVNFFLKLKYEATGWEDLGLVNASDDAKQEWLNEFERLENIKLDLQSIGATRNPGLYKFAKLCLNSLWGKFGQRDCFANTVDCFDEEDFLKLVFSDSVSVSDVVFHDPFTRTVTYEVDRAFAKASLINLPIACYTAAYGRLRLYEALEVLNDDVIYMDTDSVIFIQREQEEKLICGDYAGDFTNELGDDYIEEFVSTGPKSYAYRTHGGKEVCKVKGFRLDWKTSQKINFENMLGLVKRDIKFVETFPLQFLVQSSHNIQVKDWKDKGKKFSFTFDKRKIIIVDDDCIDTRPLMLYDDEEENVSREIR